MRILLSMLAAMSLAVVCMGCGGAQQGALRDTPLAGLSWMVGTWEAVDERGAVEEHWMPERGGTMMGVNRVVSGDRTVFFEFLQIEATAEGVVYRAWPEAGSGTTFRLTSWEGRRARFENRAHDFPKVIEYWQEGDDLHARVEGVEKGKPRTSKWIWRRVE